MVADWQQRVIEEKQELDKKLTALEKFFPTETYKNMHPEDAKLLMNQFEAMYDYSALLGYRIARFN